MEESAHVLPPPVDGDDEGELELILQDKSSDENEGNQHFSAPLHPAPAESGDASPTDDELLLIESKREAKKLGEKIYKRWKKLRKHGEHHHSKHHDKKHRHKEEKREKKEKKKKERSKAKKSKKHHREEEPVDEPIDFLSEAEAHDLVATSMPTKRRKVTGASSASPLENKAKTKVTESKLQEVAKDLIEKMKKAHQADVKSMENPAVYGPPLHRIALKEEVKSLCGRKMFIGYLLEEGILDLLGEWLMDLRKSELAPLELRSTALDILLGFPVEREEEDIKSECTGPVKALSRDNLTPSIIGSCINTLRLHASETAANRSKCAALLERFSRAFTAMNSKRTQKPHVITWKCKNDEGTGGAVSDVASPFEAVPTVSEQFQRDFMRPDPLDPTSYHNLLTPRPPVQIVANVSGRLREKYAENAGN